MFRIMSIFFMNAWLNKTSVFSCLILGLPWNGYIGIVCGQTGICLLFFYAFTGMLFFICVKQKKKSAKKLKWAGNQWNLICLVCLVDMTSEMNLILFYHIKFCSLFYFFRIQNVELIIIALLILDYKLLS